jgi:hypothetical protein
MVCYIQYSCFFFLVFWTTHLVKKNNSIEHVTCISQQIRLFSQWNFQSTLIRVSLKHIAGLNSHYLMTDIPKQRKNVDYFFWVMTPCSPVLSCTGPSYETLEGMQKLWCGWWHREGNVSTVHNESIEEVRFCSVCDIYMLISFSICQLLPDTNIIH